MKPKQSELPSEEETCSSLSSGCYSVSEQVNHTILWAAWWGRSCWRRVRDQSEAWSSHETAAGPIFPVQFLQEVTQEGEGAFFCCLFFFFFWWTPCWCLCIFKKPSSIFTSPFSGLFFRGMLKMVLSLFPSIYVLNSWTCVSHKMHKSEVFCFFGIIPHLNFLTNRMAKTNSNVMC